MAGTDEPVPTGRDYGCGLVALASALIGAFVVCRATWLLARDGVSVGLLISIAVSLLFWYWVGVGAWRRTTWSRHRPTPRHPGGP
jgi:hypothetical protein